MADLSSTVTVRPLRAEDKAAWTLLWQGYLAFYKAEIPTEVSDLTFDRLIDPEEPMGGALAFIDGEAVGLVHLVSHRSTWTKGNYGYLQDLFAAESMRGRGVGGALIEHIYARGAELGCSRVYWLTHETNTQAMILYDRVAERSGFVQYRKLL